MNYAYGETKRESVAGNSNRIFFLNCVHLETLLVLCTWLPLTGSHGGILKARWTIQPAPHRVGKRIMILVEQKNLVD